MVVIVITARVPLTLVAPTSVALVLPLPPAEVRSVAVVAVVHSVAAVAAVAAEAVLLLADARMVDADKSTSYK